ncbi:MAG: hypothetical protein KGL58_08195 [Pseudomonadota bacterium]|nr:hypothetical protein [Pseudomonadota bacterium]
MAVVWWKRLVMLNGVRHPVSQLDPLYDYGSIPKRVMSHALLIIECGSMIAIHPASINQKTRICIH